MLTTENYAGKAPYAKTTSNTTATQGAYGSYSNARNNGGTIRANGTVSSGVATSVTTVRPVVDTFASTPIEASVTEKDYAAKAVDGTFAHNHVKPIGHLLTNELAGNSVANSVIKSPGNNGNVIRSINKLETLRSRRFTTAVRANKYNRVTDTWAAGYPVVATDTLASDVAAAPTRSNPGRLVFKSGALVPGATSYKAKTN